MGWETWTDERVELLKRLVAEGVVYRKIAQQLGMTKNAVLGKAHRLGIAGTAETRKIPKISRRRARKIARKNWETVPREAYTPAPPVPPVEDTPPATLRTFADLTPEGCRWIYGDPLRGGGFCTKDHLPGASYCETHMRRAFQPPQVKRQKIQIVEDVETHGDSKITVFREKNTVEA